MVVMVNQRFSCRAHDAWCQNHGNLRGDQWDSAVGYWLSVSKVIIQRKLFATEIRRTQRNSKYNQVFSVPSVSLVREENGWQKNYCFISCFDESQEKVWISKDNSMKSRKTCCFVGIFVPDSFVLFHSHRYKLVRISKIRLKISSAIPEFFPV